tara:strand:- start:1053 stop:1610 length:558 start_codon:yes stop_codon:yes gene_type:complete
MSDETKKPDNNQGTTGDIVAPGSQPLLVLPRVVPQATEDEVIEMLAEAARYQTDEETKSLAIRLLEAGYTVQTTARKLDIRAATVWGWSAEPPVKAAVASGKERRRVALGEGFENAAEGALRALTTILGDAQVSPRDRIKAAEAVLDRSGLVDADTGTPAQAMVAIDVDFDERLARIVASSGTKS